ncbi:MAG: universal stress protein [Betaproteobacteria bacterium]|nr:universal stress protein [Betaproteobacteria bacterium]
MKILVACDGSKTSLRAVRHAIKLAGALTGTTRISLISVHDDIALRHASRFVGKDAIDNYLRDESETDLAAARKALDKAGIDHDMIIRRGHVAAEIADAAARGRFDLIVMGSKGRSSLADLLVGSVATRVIELSAVPTLLVK